MQTQILLKVPVIYAFSLYSRVSIPDPYHSGMDESV